MPSPFEREEQRTTAAWLDGDARFRGWWNHTPNGGHRLPAVAGQLASEGVKRGVPDILVWCPLEYGGRQYVGVAVELKRRDKKASSLDPHQRVWLMRLSLAGWLVTVAHGSDDAIAYLDRVYGADYQPPDAPIRVCWGCMQTVDGRTKGGRRRCRRGDLSEQCQSTIREYDSLAALELDVIGAQEEPEPRKAKRASKKKSKKPGPGARSKDPLALPSKPLSEKDREWVEAAKSGAVKTKKPVDWSAFDI